MTLYDQFCKDPAPVLFLEKITDLGGGALGSNHQVHKIAICNEGGSKCAKIASDGDLFIYDTSRRY